MSFLPILTLLLAPSYVWRFLILGLPANALMLWVILLWIIFFTFLLRRGEIKNFIKHCLSLPGLILVGLFFLSGLAGMLVKGVDRDKLGQFLVLFFQPISLFFISSYIFSKFSQAKELFLKACYFFLALAGIYAVVQYSTLWGLPQAFWGNSNEPKRAVSFFIHPNFYALWCAPLLGFLLPDVFASLKAKSHNLKAFLWVIGSAGLLLSLSRAGWLGLGAALAVYLIFAADKKIRIAIGIAAMVLVILIASVPNLRWRFTLPFYGEKSAVSRLSLWQTGWKGISEAPITGLGLTGFAKNWQRLNTDAGLTESHNFPHNIFLDFWIETGLLGLFSFVGLVFIFIKNGLKNRSNLFKLGTALFLIALIFQGLVDNPYFKNDLAMIFWIILSLSI